MKRMTTFACKAGASLVLTLSAAAAFADAPDNVTINNIVYAGSGCPAGSVAQNVSQDASAFTLMFDDYMAEVGPGVPFFAGRVNCQLNIDLSYPSGWSFTVISIDTRGFVELDPGVTALQQSSYYFQGQDGSAVMSSNAVGPIDTDYDLTDSLTSDALVWSPCGEQRSLNIDTEVRANNFGNPTGNGLITTDSIDGQVTTVFAIQWQRCY